MPTKPTRLVFFGTEDFSAVTLQALLDDGWDVAAVITKPDTLRGRHRQLTEPQAKTVALAHRIPVLQPTKLSDVTEDLLKLQASAGILAAYGKLIPDAIISGFPRGVINIHPSLLPRYRGPSPIEQAILSNDAETGVSIMSLVKQMDAGPVYAQKTHKLRGDETQPELYAKLAHEGSELLLRTLPKILDGSLQPTPQDTSHATFTSLISKSDGNLNWQGSATVLERKIRAFAAWPQCRGTLLLSNGAHVEATITAATLDHEKIAPGLVCVRDHRVLVGTGTTALRILSLKIPGKKEITAAEFARGYRLQK